MRILFFVVILIGCNSSEKGYTAIEGENENNGELLFTYASDEFINCLNIGNFCASERIAEIPLISFSFTDSDTVIHILDSRYGTIEYDTPFIDVINKYKYKLFQNEDKSTLTGIIEISNDKLFFTNIRGDKTEYSVLNGFEDSKYYNIKDELLETKIEFYLESKFGLSLKKILKIDSYKSSCKTDMENTLLIYSVDDSWLLMDLAKELRLFKYVHPQTMSVNTVSTIDTTLFFSKKVTDSIVPASKNMNNR